MISIFRFLVVVVAGLTAIYWLLPYFDYHWLSIEQLRLLEESGKGGVLTVGQFFGWAMFAVWMALSVGIYFFLKYTREAFVFFYLLQFGVTLLSGVQVFTPFDIVVLGLIQVGDGMLIAMMYFTSVSDRFRAIS